MGWGVQTIAFCPKIKWVVSGQTQWLFIASVKKMDASSGPKRSTGEECCWYQACWISLEKHFTFKHIKHKVLEQVGSSGGQNLYFLISKDNPLLPQIESLGSVARPVTRLSTYMCGPGTQQAEWAQLMEAHAEGQKHPPLANPNAQTHTTSPNRSALAKMKADAPRSSERRSEMFLG